jgi:hypothetical protein
MSATKSATLILPTAAPTMLNPFRAVDTAVHAVPIAFDPISS